MKTKLYADTRKPLAIYALSAFMGIGIYEYDSTEERMLVAALFEDKRSKLTWCKLYTNKAGYSYFIKYGRRYYLHEMLRTWSF